MAKVEVVVKGEETGLEGEPLLETAHTLFLASIGAAALAGEAMTNWISRFAERGEEVQAHARQMLKERTASQRLEVRTVLRRGRKRAEDTEDELQKQVEAVVGQMSVPTKSDIDHLSAQVAALSSKLDELKKTKQKAGDTSEDKAE
jgi:poly(hydroxyalkanoate) granule-associated protein